MMLSMRMILNRLENFSIQSFINNDEDAADLMSARMAYAPNCLHVSAQGRDVLCQNTRGSRFLLLDIGLQEGFEIIQGIFDYYNDWEANVLRLVTEKKYQELIDSCHLIFHNPIALMDGNNQVIATSSAYGENDVDEEWKYLKRNGFSSIEAVDFLKHFAQVVDHSLMNKPQILSLERGQMSARLANIKIYWNNKFCGRMVVLEKDRELNSADLQVMSHLQGIIAPYLAQESLSSAYMNYKDVFSEIILLGKGDQLLLEKHLAYLHWLDAREFRMLLVKLLPHYSDDLILHQLRRTVLKIFPYSSVNIIDQCLVVILKAEDLEARTVDSFVDDLMLRDKARICVSLPIQDLTKLHYYFKQICYAIDRTSSQDPNAPVIYAFESSIPYMIQASDPNDLLCACHPDVLKLAGEGRNMMSDAIKLLRAYLDNERNITSTSKALYMHRNTLVYRLEKLQAQLTADLDRAYERDYIRLSIYVLESMAPQMEQMMDPDDMRSRR